MVNKALAKKKKNPVGRPRFEITPKVLKEVESYAERGLNRRQAAYKLGISITTFFDRQAEFPEFSDAFNRGKATGISNIVNVIYKKAYVDKDFNSAKYWLNNRAGWADKKEIAQTIEHKEVIDLTRISDSALAELENAYASPTIGRNSGGEIQKISEGVYEGELVDD